MEPSLDQVRGAKFRDPTEAWHDYVYGVIKLMIWHVWALHHDSDNRASVQENLDKRVDIMRKTVLFDGRHPAVGLNPPIPEWDELKTELASRITRVGRSEETQDLEDRCWELLWPLIEPTMHRAPKQLEDVKVRPYRCWSYDLKEKWPWRVGLHFANAYQPQSPFRHGRGDLLDSLRRLLEDVRSSHPEVKRVICVSWLNQFEPFQALFPPSWKASFVPIYDSWATYGWWGQYMTHEGGFHQRNGHLFRLHRHHPYTSGDSQCGIDEALDHLQSLAETN